MRSFWFVKGKKTDQRDCPDAFIKDNDWKVGDMVIFIYVEEIDGEVEHTKELKETEVRHKLVSSGNGVSFEQAPKKK